MKKTRRILNLACTFLIVTASPALANDTKLIQFYLNKLGYGVGPVDGIAGRKTRRAIEDFYKEQSLFSQNATPEDVVNALIQVVDQENIKGRHYGLCRQDQPEHHYEKRFDETFNLLNHKVIKTSIPAYRSFSFGTQDPAKGNTPSPEIKGVGDVNNDGIDDLIIDYYETAVQPVILLGQKNGRFLVRPVSDKASARRHIRNGEFVDINNDGLLDFVGFTTGDPGIRWIENGSETFGQDIPRGETDILLINQGDGAFINVPIPEVGKNDWNHGGTSADLDNDGFVDILPLREGEREKTSPIINSGGKTFTLSPNEYSKDISHYLTSDMDSGDFNGDEFQDIVVTITTLQSQAPAAYEDVGALRVLYGDGDFDFRDNLEVSFGRMWLSAEEGQEIIANFRGEMMPGTNEIITEIKTGNGNVEALDVDSDGHVDILLGQYFTPNGLWSGSGFKFYRNTGTCFYDATADFFPNQDTNRNIKNNAFTNYIHNFHMGDVNNDGLPDLVLQTDGANSEWMQDYPNKGHPYVFINQNNQVFLPVNFRDGRVDSLLGLDDIVPGDFNGDGLTDILGLYARNQEVHVRLMFPRTPVDWTQVEDHFAGSYIASWYIGNVNENGKLEFQGTDQLTLSKGTGQFEGLSGFQPNHTMRRELRVQYDPDGTLSISGDLDLLDPLRSYPTTFSGDLNDLEIRTTWQEGDLIVIKLLPAP